MNKLLIFLVVIFFVSGCQSYESIDAEYVNHIEKEQTVTGEKVEVKQVEAEETNFREEEKVKPYMHGF